MAACVAIVGALYSIHLGDRLRYDDERAYVAISGNLLHGQYSLDGESPTVLWPPAWPAVLAVVGASAVYGRLVNVALLAGVVMLAARLAGPVAALMVACYPVLLYTAGTLYPQTLAMFLLTLALVSVRAGHNASGGFALGALILTAPLYVVALVVMAAWRPKAAIVLVLTAACVVAPWCIRNRLVTGRWVFVSGNSGLMLLLGNSPHATSGTGPGADISEYTQATEGMPESQRDSFYRAAALRWIAGNPAAAARLYVGKLAGHFAWRNDLVTASEGSRWKDLVMLATWGPLLLLFVARIALWRRFPPSDFERMSVTMYLMAALAQAVFFTRVRYRLPLDIIPIITTAPLVDRLVRSRNA